MSTSMVSRRAVLVGLLAFAHAHTYAASADARGACESADTPPFADIHVIFLVDKTFKPTPDAIQWVMQSAAALADREGVVLQIASFSQAAFGNSGPVLSHPLAAPVQLSPSDRSNMRRTELARRERCLTQQKAQIHAEIERQLLQTIGADVASASHTEIATSLHIVGRAFAGIDARRNILVLLSDGWEHNADQSFYANRRPREIDPKVELERLRKRGITPALYDVDVIWVGLATAKEIVPWRAAHALELYWNGALQMLGGRPLELDTVPPLPITTLVDRRAKVESNLRVRESEPSPTNKSL